MGPFSVGQVPASPQGFTINDADGNPRDLTGYTTINLLTVGPDDVQLAATAMGTLDPIAASASNQIVLRWNVNTSPFVSAGLYRFQFQFNGPGDVKDFSSIGTFVVDPIATLDNMSMWATINDVMQITGVQVTHDQLIRAQFIIDGVTNRTPSASGAVLPRDVTWLKRALAYQAVWMASQYDMFTRSSIDGVSQDGVSSKFTSKAAVYLAPLAIRSLKNVTWLRSKSLRMQTPFVDRSGGVTDPMIDDTIWNWLPMSIVQDPGFSTPWWAR